jgi:very-short-patch-repair endonuclease
MAYDNGQSPPSAEGDEPTPSPPTSRNAKAYTDLPYNPELKERAKELRRAGNLSEALLWLRLKKGQVNGWDFDRQKIIGNYIVDFYSANADLVVEIDGASHEDRQERDARRDAYLQSLGLTVLRFLDADVRDNMEGVVEAIRNHSGTSSS